KPQPFSSWFWDGRPGPTGSLPEGRRPTIAGRTTMSILDRFVRFLAAWTWTMFMSGLSVVLGMLTGMWGLTVGWLVLCRPWARGTLRIVRCEMAIHGRENLVGPAIFACNH